MTEPPIESQPAPPPSPVEEPKRDATLLRGIVETLLRELRDGAGDREKRRQVEDWMKSLAEKYPEFEIQKGLREYYLAEAQRLRSEFDTTTDIVDKLALGRSIEGLLEKASDVGR